MSLFDDKNESGEEKAKKIAEALAKALKDAGLADDAKVIYGGSGSKDEILKMLGEHGDFDEPCGSAFHEAITIATLNGFPPNRKEKPSLRAARMLPHSMEAAHIAAMTASPEFWEALARGFGWKEGTEVTPPEYMLRWHEFINAMNREYEKEKDYSKRTPGGRSDAADEFFAPFVKKHYADLKKNAEENGS